MKKKLRKKRKVVDDEGRRRRILSGHYWVRLGERKISTNNERIWSDNGGKVDVMQIHKKNTCLRKEEGGGGEVKKKDHMDLVEKW